MEVLEARGCGIVVDARQREDAATVGEKAPKLNKKRRGMV